MVVAEPAELATGDDPSRWSHVRVATKYPQVTRRHFAARGVQAECIKLNGAMELAPGLGLCRRIVDLVGTGATLQGQRPGSRWSISPTSPPGSWSTERRSRPGPASFGPGSSASARR